ncbi:RmlC-like cupin domain-containing protein [Penicillium ucsense]|uniref:RmlC-like cupin domain-containing protein n=1 Tax=Penicillium ucsense TaxID=2839758 RepID=A0A8J8WK29_9EURO|nr:RmlC-like cupin domain-containing protein [Penicillium ucsense]KAF7738822.1 RmlC-like cupin domain-containing protein [Penicillium ucsense]
MPATYPIGTRAETERLVKDWGFHHVFTWTDGSKGYYAPHSHRGLTTHLIRQGTFTITYPDENSNGEVKKETFGPGARIDVPAGKLHEVWIGEEGCEYVIGE